MEYSEKQSIKPRIIIHGGAGNITRQNLPQNSYDAYQAALLSVVRKANKELSHSSALDVVTYAVSLLEENPLFNAGRGAVYTTEGTHELEASVMVSNGYIKRGVGVMKVHKAKSPIKLAREMLTRGELSDGGGAHGHSQLEGNTIDDLAAKWGLELVKPSYFWTRRRWDEHRRGLGLEYDDETYQKHKRQADEQHGGRERMESGTGISSEQSHEKDPHWDGHEYLPQGTVGAVALDRTGTIAVATSTGGLTNKLPGRIGDTPTLGAGFWAEQWTESPSLVPEQIVISSTMFSRLIGHCLPKLAGYSALSNTDTAEMPEKNNSRVRAVAMSGTGNGDSFLRVNAVRTAAAIARYASSSAQAQSLQPGQVSLQQALTVVAGPHGQLQHSAGDRWQKTGEGEGGIIGVELLDGKGHIAFDFNCGGMFHAWIDDEGEARFGLFQDEPRSPP